ncbi:MAG TPA: glutamine--fructose-6-phosphate transaminase (isomerizing) [Elusimicrobiota bacterium]|nr:glutamine--fructose-6-phosphate transaminase (isomerizing) [Elusimicrobiota bacterium]
MCGIVGYIGGAEASGVLLDGLRRLEYRGYDSAGMATLTDGAFQLRRSVGKLAALESLLGKEPLQGKIGLGHTRWATHGHPSEDNAHPHTDCTGRIVIVHNGIIENYAGLKAELKAQGHRFSSQTDTEVVVHLLEETLKEKTSGRFGKNGSGLDLKTFLSAVRDTLGRLQGAYALGILCSDLPDVLVGARKDCPLILGLGEDEFLLASDVPAILGKTRRAVFLEEGEIAVLTGRSYRVLRQETGEEVQKKVSEIRWDALQAEKSGYRHFMIKEIFEQPRSVEDTLRSRLELDDWKYYLGNVNISAEQIRALRRISIVACGTSWHAALVGKLLLEKWAKVVCEVDMASEFRYREPLLGPEDLLVVISQSGETADTIAALRYAKERGAHTLAICNVVGSTIAREAHGKIYTHCGPEIGVASTKAFTGQLVVLYLLALYGSFVRGTLPREEAEQIMEQLLSLPRKIVEVLRLDKKIAALAKKFHQSADFLYLGRNLNYPIALEGALKLKEISYIHAEGYPAGEMKHGPIALIDEDMPVVAIATRSGVYDKLVSNIEEVKARGGTVIALASEGDDAIAAHADHVLVVPAVPEFLSPCINVVPLQLLAYHIAVLRGCDVDQPRNLAKSVTVE